LYIPLETRKAKRRRRQREELAKDIASRESKKLGAPVYDDGKPNKIRHGGHHHRRPVACVYDTLCGEYTAEGFDEPKHFRVDSLLAITCERRRRSSRPAVSRMARELLAELMNKESETDAEFILLDDRMFDEAAAYVREHGRLPSWIYAEDIDYSECDEHDLLVLKQEDEADGIALISGALAA